MCCCCCSANFWGFWGISEQAEHSQYARFSSVSSGLIKTICRYATLKTLWHLTDLISKDYNTRWGKTVLSCVRDLQIWEAFSAKSVIIQNLNVSNLPPSPSTRGYHLCVSTSTCLPLGLRGNRHTAYRRAWGAGATCGEQEGMQLSSIRETACIAGGILCYLR